MALLFGEQIDLDSIGAGPVFIIVRRLDGFFLTPHLTGGFIPLFSPSIYDSSIFSSA